MKESREMRELFSWANEDSRTFMSRNESYLRNGETIESRARVIADAAEKLLGIEGFADKFYKYLGLGYYSLSSPVWSNFGTDRGLPISCNGVFIDDDMAEIMSKLSEVGIQTKHGAGTSGYFGKLRPRGTPIKTGGVADGPVHFMRLFETAIDVVSQGNVRRGSMAAYIDIESPDVEEFLECREVGSAIQNLSMGLCISDAWFQSMVDGDVDKRKIWAKVLRKRRESGYPYLFFTDTVNNNKPQVLKDKNIPIYASNLCLKGDTEIEVKFPFVEDVVKMTIETFCVLWSIGAIVEKTAVKTEKGFMEVTAAAKTGNTKKMIKITTEDGKSVECTPDHQIFTKNRGWVMAKDLQETDELLLT